MISDSAKTTGNVEKYFLAHVRHGEFEREPRCAVEQRPEAGIADALKAGVDLLHGSDLLSKLLEGRSLFRREGPRQGHVEQPEVQGTPNLIAPPEPAEEHKQNRAAAEDGCEDKIDEDEE